MAKIETSGYKKYWELKEFRGYNPDGSKKSVEGYRDMLSGEFHAPKDGWQDAPPELPTGERGPMISNSYKRNYDNIQWAR